MLNQLEWNSFFPYSEPRSAQIRAIDNTLDAIINNNKKYAIIDCGTGVGKSAIGVTLAKAIDYYTKNDELQGSYILTTQKLLQDQYENDFKKSGMNSLYSSRNYSCIRDNIKNCNEVQSEIRICKNDKKTNKCSFDCVYKKKKNEFISCFMGVTNFAYFLTETNYSKKLPRKKILIIDEAHNIENELTKFIEISVSTYFAKHILKITIPKITTQLQALNWIKQSYFTALSKKVEHIESIIKNKFSSLTADNKILKNIDNLKSHRDKIKKFIELYDKDNWVFNISKTEKKGYIKFDFKPIDISEYAHNYLFKMADYVILMSATIISHDNFCELLGIDSNECVFTKEPSPFSPKNKPVIYAPAGKMSAKYIDETLPILSGMIKELIEQHKDEKGIIHTHTTKIANFILDNVKDDRLIFAAGDKREAAIDLHFRSKKPTIIVAPGMSEGIDLHNDYSRFQIICKIPYPYLGDKVCRKKMHKWKWWYDFQTLKGVIQSMGRSIRNADDTAITYILDSDWHHFMCKNKHLLPNNFFDSYLKL